MSVAFSAGRNTPAATSPTCPDFVHLSGFDRRRLDVSLWTKPAAELQAVRLDMPHVLVVDDDPSYLTILEKLCASCGATVVTVSTAADARAALGDGKFDLLLLDLQLERQEGLALISDVEQQPELAKKAVVVTGFALIAPAFTQLPIVDKGRLADLAEYLRKILVC